MFHPSVSDGYDDGPMIKRRNMIINPKRPAKKMVDKTGNQINVIYPYKDKGGWFFDDAEVGLYREAFVAGIPEIIEGIIGKRRKKFTAYISAGSMPDAIGHLVRDKKSKEEGWYILEGTDRRGWLCPATLKYFKKYPDSIYFRIV